MNYILPDNKLSPSRISSFGRCPACFCYQYVEKHQVKTHIALPRGAAVHAGVHAARLQVIAGDEVSVDDCVALAHDGLRDELARIDPALLDLGSTPYAKAEDAAEHVRIYTETAIRQVVLQRDQRVGILEAEARVDYSGIFPFTFDAYLDCLLVDGTFTDLKTSGGSWPPDVWAAMQVGLYALPWYLAGQPVQLCIDQVRLPTARLPARVEFFTARAEPENFEAIRQQVLDTAAAISTGIFPPKPGQFCKIDHGFGIAA